MSVPKYYEMHKPVLECLSDGKMHTMKDLKAYVIKYFQLTEEDVSSLLPSGTQTYLTNRIGWARTYLKKLGWSRVLPEQYFRLRQRKRKKWTKK